MLLPSKGLEREEEAIPAHKLKRKVCSYVQFWEGRTIPQEERSKKGHRRAPMKRERNEKREGIPEVLPRRGHGTNKPSP